ncbi:hypothetical protein Areg01_87000 [Actinoplanes regularis]|nr:hypothetical protein Areg01_87000 [Actinoplanes regularis]
MAAVGAVTKVAPVTTAVRAVNDLGSLARRIETSPVLSDPERSDIWGRIRGYRALSGLHKGAARLRLIHSYRCVGTSGDPHQRYSTMDSDL